MQSQLNDQIDELKTRLRYEATSVERIFVEIADRSPDLPLSLAETLEDIANIYLRCADRIILTHRVDG